jgi:hypothetical protein
MIIPYSWYKVNRFSVLNQKYLVSVAPVISEGEKGLPNNQDADVFTKQEFFDFLDSCEKKGVHGVLIQEEGRNTEYKKILSCVNEYRNSFSR